MNSGIKYKKGTGLAPLILYAQMGIDSAMVERIDALSADMEYLLNILTGLQEYCGTTTGE